MKQMKMTTIFLFFALLAFTSCNKTKQNNENKSVTTDNKPTQTVTPGKIAYVEIDTIFKYYDMAKELTEALEAKQKKLDAELNNKSKTLQSGALDFQNKVQKGLITQANAQEMQQQLASQEQGLYQLRDQYRGQLAEEAQVNQRQVLNSIMDYLKEYNKTKGYQYILANTFPSSILFADGNMEITKEVIEGLNANYKSVLKKK